MGSMPFKFGLKMVVIDIITRSSGGAEGTCDTTRRAASCVPRRSRNAALSAWLLTSTRLRAHTSRPCVSGLLMDGCKARAVGYTHLRIGMGWGGAFVGCGSCSSRGVTATVQMRSPGNVRFMSASWASLGRINYGSLRRSFFKPLDETLISRIPRMTLHVQ